MTRARRRAHALPAAYAAAVAAATLVHDPLVLAAGLVGVLASAGRGAGRLARRVVLAAGPFCAVVTVGFLVPAVFGAEASAGVVARFDARVFLITALTLRTAAAADWRALAAGRPRATAAAVVALGHAAAFRRRVAAAREALRSRTDGRPPVGAAVRHAGAVAACLIERATADAEAVAEAMTARGAFDAAPGPGGTAGDPWGGRGVGP